MKKGKILIPDNKLVFGNYIICDWHEMTTTKYVREIYRINYDKNRYNDNYEGRVEVYQLLSDEDWILSFNIMLDRIWYDVYRPSNIEDIEDVEQICFKSVEEAKLYADTFLNKIIKLKAFL
jgi:hypothetical protein